MSQKINLPAGASVSPVLPEFSGSFVWHKSRTRVEATRHKGGTEAASLALRLTLPLALNRLCVHQISRWTVCVMASRLVAAALTKRCVVSGLFRRALLL